MRKGLKMRMMTDNREKDGMTYNGHRRAQDYDPQSNSWSTPQYGGMMRGGMYRRDDDDDHDDWAVGGYYRKRGDRWDDGRNERSRKGWYVEERPDMRRNGRPDDWDDEPWERRNHGGKESEMEMDRETAEKWVKAMHNEDAAHPTGGRWKVEELKPMAQKLGIPNDGAKFWEFYAMTNAMYSDYSEVGKKFGITSPDFYASMAKAWMEDKDAVKDKTAMYYECIVKK